MRQCGGWAERSTYLLCLGMLLLASCDSADAGDGAAAGASGANGGTSQLSSAGATGTTKVRTTMLTRGGQSATGSTATANGGSSTGGASEQAGGVTGTAPSGGAGSTELDFNCSSAEDCCAVVNNCNNTMTVVGLPNKAIAEASAANSDPFWCNSCMPPQVQVACIEGVCLGYKVGVGTTWPGSGLSGTHCGVLSTGGTNAGAASVEFAQVDIAATGGAAAQSGASSTGGQTSSGGASNGSSSTKLGVQFGCI